MHHHLNNIILLIPNMYTCYLGMLSAKMLMYTLNAFILCIFIGARIFVFSSLFVALNTSNGCQTRRLQPFMNTKINLIHWAIRRSTIPSSRLIRDSTRAVIANISTRWRPVPRKPQNLAAVLRLSPRGESMNVCHLSCCSST